MATTAVLHPDPQRFPAGITAKAYLRSNFPAIPTVPVGPPQGSQTASATVANDGSVTFTGLAEETRYVLYAASPDRYASFSTLTDPRAAGSSFAHLVEDADGYLFADWPLISEQALGGDVAFAARVAGDGDGVYGRWGVSADGRMFFDGDGDGMNVTYVENPSPNVLTIAGVPIAVFAHFHEVSGNPVSDNKLAASEDGLAWSASSVGAVIDTDGSFTSQPVDASIYAAFAIIVPTENDYRWYRGGDGTEFYGDGTNPQDVSWGRKAAGVLGIAEAGGGIRLKSPDGLTTKTITIDNSGTLVLA